MNALFLHLFSAPDEQPATALRDLLECFEQRGIIPTVRLHPSDDQVRVVAEVQKDLFDEMCESLAEWGSRHRGRDAGTKAPRLLTRPSEVTFTLTLLIERPTKAGATTA